MSFLPVVEDNISNEVAHSDSGNGFFIEDTSDENDGATTATTEETQSNEPTSPLSPNNVKTKTDHGRIPSKPILRTCVEESIPINTKKKAWKTLPTPDLERVKMIRVASLNSFLQNEDTDTTTTSTEDESTTADSSRVRSTSTGNMKRTNSKVRFQEITIREYDITMGDNPAVTYGTPISLNWKYEELPTMVLDEYEAHRSRRRTLREMFLSYYQRKSILIHKCGFTEEEVKAAKKRAQKIQMQRGMTKAVVQTPVLSKLEEMGESAGRKFNRLTRRRDSMEGFVAGSRMFRSASVPILHEDFSTRSAATI